MILNVEAIYANGVLRPTERLPLRENERVRVTVEGCETPADGSDATRREAVDKFRAGAAASTFTSTERYPDRDALHDRR